ncbi:MAG: Proline--tRNA ligase [Puniceicoccaceae bacterium MED-G32]|nr:MAG: Proline--tRNA ligase [Puniceicoccaceae bacterium MED-G32]
MSQKPKTAITPTRVENYPEWYQQVIKAADLAETSPVRGCMVIKPWGYAIWENIQKELDRRFKATGHKNAYFPLFIPMRYLQKEADHVDGFAKECAVVTHSRLEADENGQLQPAGPLDEPLIVRPTSETIIGELFAKWVQSYRDLPLLINQWANVVRWEMRTRLFLRTSEFLWQEGHTVHATEEEAMVETRTMLDVYADFSENYLAMPVIKGEKTEAERFPGAVSTYSIEAMMQDKKALQAGTSHFLGQNFAKSSSIKFLNAESKEEHAWTTSWGVSTRLVGGLIMTHSDDDGLVLPPAIAPAHVVILPVTPKPDSRDAVIEYCRDLKQALEAQSYLGEPVRVELDDRDIRGGEKTWSWVKKGVPVRIEVGPRDMEKEAVFYARRDKAVKDKVSQEKASFVSEITALLENIQSNLFKKAQDFQKTHTQSIDNKEDFEAYFADEDAGYASVGFCLDSQLEDELAKRLKISVRCIPNDTVAETVPCIFTGKDGKRVIFARSY